MEMDGILLNKNIGIVGGGITGLVVAIFLAKKGHAVSIFEKNKLLSETSSKTSKLLHGGLRYLENLHFREVKNGLKDRSWWRENFPNNTKKLQISIPFSSQFSLTLIKSFIAIGIPPRGFEMSASSAFFKASSVLIVTYAWT